mgnify:CR=1 FL=1
MERKWASNKRFEISIDLQYPTYYNVDRDIVHPTAFGIAEKRGIAIEPETVDEILHDMEDAVRFKVSVQSKTDKLLDMLVELGELGIRGFFEPWLERRRVFRHGLLSGGGVEEETAGFFYLAAGGADGQRQLGFYPVVGQTRRGATARLVSRFCADSLPPEALSGLETGRFCWDFPYPSV